MPETLEELIRREMCLLPTCSAHEAIVKRVAAAVRKHYQPKLDPSPLAEAAAETAKLNEPIEVSTKE